MKIAKRLKNGWTKRVPNKQKYNCDDCGSQLWVAPDGKSVYCDAVHKTTTAADRAWAKAFKGTAKEFIDQAQKRNLPDRSIKYWVKYNWNIGDAV